MPPESSGTAASVIVQTASPLLTESGAAGCTDSVCVTCVSHYCIPEAHRHCDIPSPCLISDAMTVSTKTTGAVLDVGQAAPRVVPAIPVRLPVVSKPLIIRALPKSEKLGSLRPVAMVRSSGPSLIRRSFSREKTSSGACSLSEYYRHVYPVPARVPSSMPASVPSASVLSSVPASVPSFVPASVPSYVPASFLSSVPASVPSVPASVPFSVPTGVPSSVPAGVPSSVPDSVPSSVPTSIPSSVPTRVPSSVPNSPLSSTPAGVHSMPASVYSVPASVYSVPAGVHSIPASVLCSMPVGVHSHPASVHSRPAGVHSLPANVHSRLAGVHSMLANVHSMPVGVLSPMPTSVHSRPASVHSRPASVHSMPAGVISSIPVGVHSRPASVHSKPAGVHSLPAGAHSMPAGVHSMPASAQPMPADVLCSLPAGVHSLPGSVHSRPASVQSTPATVLSSLPAGVHSLPASVQSMPAGVLSSMPAGVHSMPASVHYLPDSVHSLTASVHSMSTSVLSSVSASFPSVMPASVPSMSSKPAGFSSFVPAALASSLPACLPTIPASLPSFMTAPLPSYVPASLPSSHHGKSASARMGVDDNRSASALDLLVSLFNGNPVNDLMSSEVGLSENGPCGLESCTVGSSACVGKGVWHDHMSRPGRQQDVVHEQNKSRFRKRAPTKPIIDPSPPRQSKSTTSVTIGREPRGRPPKPIRSTAQKSTSSAALVTHPKDKRNSVNEPTSAAPKSQESGFGDSFRESASAAPVSVPVSASTNQPVSTENTRTVTDSECSTLDSLQFRTAAELVKIRSRPKTSYREAATPLPKPGRKRRKQTRRRKETRVAEQANESQSRRSSLTAAAAPPSGGFASESKEESYVGCRNSLTECRSLPTLKIRRPVANPVRLLEVTAEAEAAEEKSSPETFRPLSSSSPKHPRSPPSRPSSLLALSPLRHQSPPRTVQRTYYSATIRKCQARAELATGAGLASVDLLAPRRHICDQADQLEPPKTSAAVDNYPIARDAKLMNNKCEAGTTFPRPGISREKPPGPDVPFNVQAALLDREKNDCQRFLGNEQRDHSSREKLSDHILSPDRLTADNKLHSLELPPEEETILYPVEEEGSEASDTSPHGYHAFSFAALGQQMEEDENFGNHVPFSLMPILTKQEPGEQAGENPSCHEVDESIEASREGDSPGTFSTSSLNPSSLGYCDHKMEADNAIYLPATSLIDIEENILRNRDFHRTHDLHEKRPESHQRGCRLTGQENEASSSWQRISAPWQHAERGTAQLRSSTISPSSEAALTSTSLREEVALLLSLKAARSSFPFSASASSSETHLTPRPQQPRQETLDPLESPEASTSCPSPSSPSSLSPLPSPPWWMWHSSPQKLSPKETAALLQSPTSPSSSSSSCSSSSSSSSSPFSSPQSPSPSRRDHPTSSTPQQPLQESATSAQPPSRTPFHRIPPYTQDTEDTEGWNSTKHCRQTSPYQLQRLQELSFALSNQSETWTDSNNHSSKLRLATVSKPVERFHRLGVLQQGTLVIDHLDRLQRQIQSMQDQLTNLHQHVGEIKQLLQEQQRQRRKSFKRR